MNCKKCGGQYCSVDRCLPPAPKTMADHARSYRQRRAEKMARMEAALREISELVACAFAGTLVAPLTLDAIDDIVKAALNPGKEMGE